MIIDADTHICPFEGENKIFAETLIDMMDKSKIDKAVTWLTPLHTREIEQSNKYIYDAVKRYPDSLLGFGWTDPYFGIEKAKETIKRCTQEYGFYGVKMNGAQNEFRIDDPLVSIPIIEEIAKTGKLLAFHSGADAYDFTHPYRVGKIAKLFPEVTILLVHIGGAGIPNLSGPAIEIAGENSNVYLIGSTVGAKAILNAVKTLGAKKVCFGSDTPFEFMDVELSKYNTLFKGKISKEDYDLIMGGNIKRIFGI